MNAKRIANRVCRIALGLLVVALAGAALPSSPVGAQVQAPPDPAVGATFVPGDESASAHANRTTTSGLVGRPAFANTPCPGLTDSIVRLYSAYFLRAPDQGGFEFWTAEFAAGNWSLPSMSAFFSESPEFVDMYGGVTDAEFIDLIYRNIFGRAADDGGRDYWLGRMQNEGIDRGTVMLFFSESTEYVEQSATARPLAGDFNWYPEGTTWDCGFGFKELEIPASGTYLDLVIYNPTTRPIQVSVNQRRSGIWENATSLSLDPSIFYIYFGVPFPQDSIVDRVQVGAGGADLVWAVVYSPTPTPIERAGWVPV